MRTPNYYIQHDGRDQSKPFLVKRDPTKTEASIRTEQDGMATRYEHMDQSEHFGWSPLEVGRVATLDDARAIVAEDQRTIASLDPDCTPGSIIQEPTYGGTSTE